MEEIQDRAAEWAPTKQIPGLAMMKHFILSMSDSRKRINQSHADGREALGLSPMEEGTEARTEDEMGNIEVSGDRTETHHHYPAAAAKAAVAAATGTGILPILATGLAAAGLTWAGMGGLTDSTETTPAIENTDTDTQYNFGLGTPPEE
jgi:hypothetical protein